MSDTNECCRSRSPRRVVQRRPGPAFIAWSSSPTRPSFIARVIGLGHLVAGAWAMGLNARS